MKKQKLSVWKVILSVLAAMFGVQNSKVLHRDFSSGRPWVFVVIGLIAVVLFVLILVGVVQWVLTK